MQILLQIVTVLGLIICVIVPFIIIHAAITDRSRR